MIQLNLFLLAYLVLFVVTSVADMVIDRINVRYMERFKGQIPEPFQGMIDGEKLDRINQYTIDKTRFSLVSAVTGKIVFLAIILSGFLPWLCGLLENTHFIWAGLVFFAVPGLISGVIDLPFDYYHIFVIEERYGFNTRTRWIWLTDLIKSLLIGSILGAVLLSTP